MRTEEEAMTFKPARRVLKLSPGRPLMTSKFWKLPEACLRLWLPACLLIQAESAAAELGRSTPPLLMPETPSLPQKSSPFSRGLQALQVRDYAEALVQFEHASSAIRLEDMPLAWLSANDKVCQTLCLLGRRAEAIDRARLAAEQCETALGADDPLTSEALSHLANLLKKDGRLNEAEPVYARKLARLVDKYGEDSLFVAEARTHLASLQMQLGRMEEAEVQHRKAVAAAQSSLGDGHEGNCFYLTHLASCLHAVRKTPEATTLMDKVVRLLRDHDQQDVSHLGFVLRRQAQFFLETRQLDKARKAGQLCLERLAARDETNRARLHYYDQVRDLYQSILLADGLKPGEVKMHLAKVEAQARSGR